MRNLSLFNLILSHIESNENLLFCSIPKIDNVKVLLSFIHINLFYHISLTTEENEGN